MCHSVYFIIFCVAVPPTSPHPLPPTPPRVGHPAQGYVNEPSHRSQHIDRRELVDVRVRTTLLVGTYSLCVGISVVHKGRPGFPLCIPPPPIAPRAYPRRHRSLFYKGGCTGGLRYTRGIRHPLTALMVSGSMVLSCVPPMGGSDLRSSGDVRAT
jgi:hypothetical protein